MNCHFNEGPCRLRCNPGECALLKATEAANKARRYDFRKIVEEIEKSGTSLHQLAIALDLQYIQIQRIKETGRCQHYVGERLLEIHARCVPHETLQGVLGIRAMEMRMA